MPDHDARVIDLRLLRETPRFTVYEGMWAPTAQRCVLKVAHDPSRVTIDRAHFRAEARILSLLDEQLH